MIRVALTFPGIVVMIARGREVTLFQNGQPVAGKKTWSVEGENNLVYDVSTHVRLSREARPLLVSLASVKNGIMPGDPPEPMPKDWTLERLIFDRIKLDPANAVVPEFTEFKQDLTPEQVREEALNPETTVQRIQDLYRYVFKAFPGVTLIGKDNTEELLLDTLTRVGKERRSAGSGRGHAAKPAQPAVDLGDWAALLDTITGPDDGAQAEAQVDNAVRDGALDEVKAGAVKRAIKAKVAEAAGQAAA